MTTRFVTYIRQDILPLLAPEKQAASCSRKKVVRNEQRSVESLNGVTYGFREAFSSCQEGRYCRFSQSLKDSKPEVSQALVRVKYQLGASFSMFLDCNIGYLIKGPYAGLAP